MRKRTKHNSPSRFQFRNNIKSAKLIFVCIEGNQAFQVIPPHPRKALPLYFFARPIALNSYKDVQELYDDANGFGHNIDPFPCKGLATLTRALPLFRLFIFEKFLHSTDFFNDPEEPTD
jgi:hypothetical protein